MRLPACSSRTFLPSERQEGRSDGEGVRIMSILGQIRTPWLIKNSSNSTL